MLILLLSLPLELALLYFTIRRSGFVPFPHVLLVYLIGCQVSIFLVAEGLADYSFLRTYSTYAFSTHYISSQILLIAIYFSLFLIFIPPPDVRFFANMESALRHSIDLSASVKGARFAVILLWCYHILLFLSLQWQLVWENTTYLLMSGEDILALVNPFTKFLIAIFPLVGLLAFAILGVFAWRKGSYLAVALLPLAAFDLLYQLGAHSRKAVLFVLVYAGLSYMIRRSRSGFLFGVFFATSILIFCLGGRSYLFHGISTIFSPLEIASAYFLKDPSFAFFNLFEGGFSTTELFSRSYNYSEQYKILSFSPLPSFIDGFGRIQDAEMHKLGPFSPPSAIFEAWSFGAPYVLLLILTQVVTGRFVIKLLSKERGLLAIAANVTMVFAVYMEFGYPVRNVYRFFLIALILSLIGLYLSRPRHHRVAVRFSTKAISETLIRQ